MLDKFGIVSSGVCIAHCSLPILLSFTSPSLTVYLGNEWIHFTLLITVITVAIFSLLNSKQLHKKNLSFLLVIVGIFLLIFAVTAEISLNEIKKHFELFFTFLGSLALTPNHFVNLQLLNKQELK